MGRGLLNERVALITGAGRGLGQAVAVEFADEGAAVALIDVNPNTLSETEGKLKRKGIRVLAFPLNITDYDSYARAVAQTADPNGDC